MSGELLYYVRDNEILFDYVGSNNILGFWAMTASNKLFKNVKNENKIERFIEERDFKAYVFLPHNEEKILIFEHYNNEYKCTDIINYIDDIVDTCDDIIYIHIRFMDDKDLLKFKMLFCT